MDQDLSAISVLLDKYSSVNKSYLKQIGCLPMWQSTPRKENVWLSPNSGGYDGPLVAQLCHASSMPTKMLPPLRCARCVIHSVVETGESKPEHDIHGSYVLYRVETTALDPKIHSTSLPVLLQPHTLAFGHHLRVVQYC